MACWLFRVRLITFISQISHYFQSWSNIFILLTQPPFFVISAHPIYYLWCVFGTSCIDHLYSLLEQQHGRIAGDIDQHFSDLFFSRSTATLCSDFLMSYTDIAVVRITFTCIYFDVLFWTKLVIFLSKFTLQVSLEFYRWLVDRFTAGLAKKRAMLIFPRTLGNTGIYREILGNKIDS